MNIQNKERLYWICQTGGWLLFVSLEIINYSMIDGFKMPLLINALVNFVLGIVITHLYRIFLIQTGWLNLSLYKLIPRVILAVVVMSVALAAINLPLDRYTYPIFQKIELDAVIIFNYLFNLSKYILLWSLTYHLFQYWEKSLLAEKERYQLKAAMRENAYNNLKTQLNPHFLFNSLNSIRTLIDLEPDSAKIAITRLSELLRSSLNTAKEKTVSLEDEIQTVKNYLAIEHIRFDDRLKVKYDIDKDALSCRVPPLMLQTLVENAVKHGIAKHKSGGDIHLIIYKQTHTLTIDIINTGQYTPSHLHTGVGIANTRERLALLYDDNAVFEIKNLNADQVLTHLTIPI